MPRPLAACPEDLHKIFKDLDQDLHARTPKRISRVHHKRTTRSSEKPPRTAFIQAPLRHLQDLHARPFTLCEPAQLKCTGTYHKSSFMQEFEGKMPRPRTGTTVFCEPAQSKYTWTSHKSNFYERMYRKNAAPQDQGKLAPQTLCEPTQSKCNWTFHKSPFMQKFTGKRPKTSWSTLIKQHRPLHLP